MSIFRPLLEGFKSLSKATKNYYSAWSTLGSAFKLKAECSGQLILATVLES